MDSYKVKGVQDTYNLQFGKNGFKVLDTSYVGNDVFSYLMIIENSRVSATSLNNRSDNLSNIDLPLGLSLPGEFSNVRLASGKIIAFY